MKKVKLEYTKQGYSYIKCTADDCFKWGGMAICDNCNEAMKEEIYLIFILGRALCKSCFKEWENETKRYIEDIKLQKERHIEWYRAYGFNIENED